MGRRPLNGSAGPPEINKPPRATRRTHRHLQAPQRNTKPPPHTIIVGVRRLRGEAFALLCTGWLRDGFEFRRGFRMVVRHANRGCIALGCKGVNGGVFEGVLDCLRRDVLAARSRLDCASINIRIEQQARHA